MFNLARYRKFFVAAFFFTLIVVMRYYNVQIPGFEQQITQVLVEVVIAAIGSAGVYQVRNEA